VVQPRVLVTKRKVCPLLIDGGGIPLGIVVAAANRNDSPLLAPTLENLSRFGFELPKKFSVHLASPKWMRGSGSEGGGLELLLLTSSVTVSALVIRHGLGCLRCGDNGSLGPRYVRTISD
jgi:hypothetical protein